MNMVLKYHFISYSIHIMKSLLKIHINECCIITKIFWLISQYPLLQIHTEPFPSLTQSFYCIEFIVIDFYIECSFCDDIIIVSYILL